MGRVPERNVRFLIMSEQTNHSPTASLDPARWHRRLCEVTPWLVLSGDLPYDRDQARQQLLEWIEADITDIIDVRGEASDETLVAEHAPHIRYHWLGTHDDGGAQADDWFEAGLAAAALTKQNGGRAIVHCHMGVNRAPSLAYRLLLEEGFDTIDALARIRSARPIAAILYADDALDHFHRAHGITPSVAGLERAEVRQWLSDNSVDVRWIISRIRRAT